MRLALFRAPAGACCCTEATTAPCRRQTADRVRAPSGSLKTRARCTTTMCAAHSALARRIRARLPSRAAFRPSLSPSPRTLFGTRLTSATSSTLASCPRFSWRACSTRVSATSSCLLAAPALASSSATVRVWAKGGKSQVWFAMPCICRPLPQCHVHTYIYIRSPSSCTVSVCMYCVTVCAGAIYAYTHVHTYACVFVHVCMRAREREGQRVVCVARAGAGAGACAQLTATPVPGPA
jgi:hypothetical protein